MLTTHVNRNINNQLLKIAAKKPKASGKKKTEETKQDEQDDVGFDSLSIASHTSHGYLSPNGNATKLSRINVGRLSQF
jgi:hypothetical protein